MKGGAGGNERGLIVVGEIAPQAADDEGFHGGARPATTVGVRTDSGYRFGSFNGVAKCRPQRR
jgi:hypothetical protein